MFIAHCGEIQIKDDMSYGKKFIISMRRKLSEIKRNDYESLDEESLLELCKSLNSIVESTVQYPKFQRKANREYEKLLNIYTNKRWRGRGYLQRKESA